MVGNGGNESSFLSRLVGLGPRREGRCPRLSLARTEWAPRPAPPAPPALGASLLAGGQGLRVTLASCTTAWTLPAAGTPLGTDRNSDGIDDSARCNGTVTVTQREVPLAQLVNATTFEYRPGDFGVTPTATSTFADGTTLHLMAQFRLPREADNGYHNASLTFDLLFEAVQRGDVNR